MGQVGNAKTSSTVPANQYEETTKLLAYMREMLQELRRLSPAAAGPMLPYLIDMARAEAAEAEQKVSFGDF